MGAGAAGIAVTHVLVHDATLDRVWALLLAEGSNPLTTVLAPIAYALTVWGGALYLVAGALYLVQTVSLVRAARAGTGGAVPEPR